MSEQQDLRGNTEMLMRNSFKRRLLHVWLFLLVSFHYFQRYSGKAEQNRMLRIIRGVRFVSDDFLLPESMCLNTNSDPCPNYRAVRNKSHGINECLCYCSETQATFYEPKRQCVGNQQVRADSGNCKYHFKYENIKEELLTLSLYTPLHIESPPGKKCKINLLHLTGNKYLNCNGHWESIPMTELNTKFDTDLKPSNNPYLKLKQDGNTTVLPHLNGRLIKLIMECSPPSGLRPLDDSCLLFKVNGTATCPLMINQFTTLTTTSKSASMHEISTSSTTKITVATNNTLIRETSVTAGKTSLTDKTVRTTVQTTPSASENRNNVRKTKLQSKTMHRIVAGVVGGVSGSLIIIFVAVFFTRRWPNMRLPGAVVSSDDVDGHEMYMGPSVSNLQQEKARTISRDSGRYTESWYEEVPDDKALKESQRQESFYQEISTPAQETSSSNSEVYDDIQTRECNSESVNSNQKGFFNPGFQTEPEHDVIEDNDESQTFSGSTETRTSENSAAEPRYVECKKKYSTETLDEQYVELEENKNHMKENDKVDRHSIDRNSAEIVSESSSSVSIAFPSEVIPNEVLKSNGNRYGDSSEYIEVIRDDLEFSPPYENVDPSFDEDREYEIPTMPIPSQTSPKIRESAAGYEKMGCQASDVDAADYSVTSELFTNSLSTKL